MKPVFRSVVMPTVGMLLMAAVALGAPATPVLAADPGDSGKTQTVTVAPAGDEAGRGTVNLQGFVQPLDTRSLAPLRTTTSVVSHGGIETGTVSAPATAGSGAAAAPHSPVLDLGTPARGNGGLIGGYAGYRFNEEKIAPARATASTFRWHRTRWRPPTSSGCNPAWTTGRFSLPPGRSVRASTPPTRSKVPAASAAAAPASAPATRRPVSATSVSASVSAMPPPSWTVQTQAAYARQLRALESDTIDGEPATYQFFGGVIINYKF